MLAITITKHGSVGMKVSATGGQRAIETKYSSDAGELAALALNMAGAYGGDSYVIVGPLEVMNFIPEKLRSK